MNQGDIVLVMFPFSNLIDYKIRPALIVSGEKLKGGDDWFCPITTKERLGSIKINNFLEEGSLDRESFVNFSTIATIDSSRILKKIAHVKKQKMILIIEKIIENFQN